MAIPEDEFTAAVQGCLIANNNPGTVVEYIAAWSEAELNKRVPRRGQGSLEECEQEENQGRVNTDDGPGHRNAHSYRLGLVRRRLAAHTS